MIQYNNRLIPDVGKCFKVANKYVLTCAIDDDYEEVEIGEDIVELFTNHYILGGKFEIVFSPDIKKKLIHQLFSNDDQIAILLNYQLSKTVENKTKYNLMQNWRQWFSVIINKIKESNYE